MRTKGIGPNNLGISPLKLKSSPKKDPPIQGGVLDEVTVTAKAPKNKIVPFKGNKFVGGSPPIVGGGKAVKVGFNLAKKAAGMVSKHAPKVMKGIGEVIEASGTYKTIKSKLR